MASAITSDIQDNKHIKPHTWYSICIFNTLQKHNLGHQHLSLLITLTKNITFRLSQQKYSYSNCKKGKFHRRHWNCFEKCKMPTSPKQNQHSPTSFSNTTSQKVKCIKHSSCWLNTPDKKSQNNIHVLSPTQTPYHTSVIRLTYISNPKLDETTTWTQCTDPFNLSLH